MPELDIKRLDEEFNIESIEKDAKEIKQDLENIEVSDNPQEILKDNIARANRILNMVEKTMESREKGGFSAALVEVAGQLINSVTNSANQIIASQYNEQFIDIKQQIIDLKAIELKIRAKQLDLRRNGGVTKQQIIVTDRESIMKILKDGKKRLQIEEKNDLQKV